MKDFNYSIERVRLAVAALKKGRGVVVSDDESRENEGDLFFPAESVTPEQMALLIRDCSGIVCLSITGEKAEELKLPYMVDNNTSKNHTAFTVTIEAAEGVTTGVSASDRVTTIKAAVADNAKPEDLSRPGHVFPLVAKDGGVLERPGHTEAGVDLMKLAGLKPAAVLCELTNPDGTMSKGDEVKAYAAKHDFPFLTVEDIINYIKSENLIKPA